MTSRTTPWKPNSMPSRYRGIDVTSRTRRTPSGRNTVTSCVGAASVATPGTNVGQRGVLEVVGRAAEDDRQRRIGVLDVAVEVDLVDAVGRVLDHVAVPRLALLLAGERRVPVALGQRVGEPVHRRQDTREQQRQREAPMPPALLGQLDCGLHDEVARDAQDHQQLGQRRVGPRGGGTHLFEIARPAPRRPRRPDR